MKLLTATLGLAGLLAAALSASAAFVSFGVNGSTPASTCSDSIPAPAAAVGFNTCTFAFEPTNLNRVDTNNTGTSTVNTDFWVANSYQNFVAQPSDFSINNGAMKVNKSGCTTGGAGHTCGAGDNSPTLSTVYLPSGASTYHGRTFQNGFYVRFTIAFDESLGVSNTPFPAMWMANWGGTVTQEYLEIDVLDALVGLPGTVIRPTFHHHWNAPGQAANTSTQFALAGAGLVFDGTTYNTIDMLWVPTTKNGGTGYTKTYYNGTQQTGYDLSYTQAGMASVGSGGVDPANFNGAFYAAEISPSIGFMLFISVGQVASNGNWPMWIKKVEVWQQSSSDMLVVN